MFKYDFIILYEHRQRELENAVLLAMMLEKKGYKVAIEYRWSARILFQRADVLIAPYLYQDKTVIDFVFQPFCHFKKVINMQYEQVFLKKNEDTLGDLPKDSAVHAAHISWGKNTTERYKKVGIKQENIFEIGHISMDLNMPKYRSVFLDKQKVSKSLNIPIEKKWLLFISSFSCVGLTKTEYEKWKKQTISVEYFTDISYQSQPIILDYFEKFAYNHPELVIIYRPHPHEATCKRLNELQKKYDNFKVITNYSIRQWIVVSDYISTWCSTSLVDVLYAKKPCAIIRPISFSKDYDYNIFNDQNIISNYQNLDDFFYNPSEHYMINSEPIAEYYCNDEKANTFEKLCNVCIQVKNNKKFEHSYYKDIHVSPIYLFMLYVYKILLTLAVFVDYSRFVPDKYRSDVQYSHREMYKYKDEIKFYRNRFAEIVNSEKT